MILSLCDSPDVLKVVRLVNTVILIIKIVVPIVLLVSGMIDFTRAITSKDSDALAKEGNLIVKKLIAALLIFLIPTLVNVIVRTSSDNLEYVKCLKNATEEGISEAYDNQMNLLIERYKVTGSSQDYDAARSYINNITDLQKKKTYATLLENIKKSKS